MIFLHARKIAMDINNWTYPIQCPASTFVSSTSDYNTTIIGTCTIIRIICRHVCAQSKNNQTD
ncbi:MAG: hypothetical protein PARBB_00711 [Parabacteroides distasonis]